MALPSFLPRASALLGARFAKRAPAWPSVRYHAVLAAEVRSGDNQSLEENIYKLAGRKFNIKSPQQISNLLYKDKGLAPPPNFPSLASGRPSASIEALGALAESEGIPGADHELVRLILEWKRRSKRSGGGGGGGGITARGEASSTAAAAHRTESGPGKQAGQAAARETAVTAADKADGNGIASEAAVEAAVAVRPPDVLLVDGTYLLHRAFHGMPAQLSGPNGQSVGTLLVFCNCISKAVLAPAVRGVKTRVVVAFDQGTSFRREVYPEYKAQRKKSTPELREQLALAPEACRAYGLPVAAVDGFEADDIIATLATEAAKAGLETLIASADKDLMQLVCDQINMLDVFKGERLGAAEVKARLGVHPPKVRDLLALTGDASDNLPGVPSVGPKTAVKLLDELGSLEAILAAAAAVPAGKRTKRDAALVAGEESALLTRELVELTTNVPLRIQIKQLLPYEPPSGDRLTELTSFFERYGLRSLERRTLALLKTPGERDESGRQMPAVAETLNGSQARTSPVQAAAVTAAAHGAGKADEPVPSPNDLPPAGSLPAVGAVPVAAEATPSA